MDTPDATPVGESPNPRRRRRRGAKALVAVLAFGVLVAAAGVLVTKSGQGQRLLVDVALSRARGMLAGELVVTDVRSPSVFRGVTLVGVRLDAAPGRRFLEADSIRVRYSLIGLLTGNLRVASVSLWRPRVEISRLPGEAGTNVEGLLREGPQPDTTPPGRPFTIGTLRVEGGTLEILTPVEGEPVERVPTMPAPDGSGLLRRVGFENVTMEVRDVVLTPRTAALLTARLAALSTDVFLLDQPLRLSGVEGDLRYGAEGLGLQNAAFRLPDSGFEGSLTFGPPDSVGGAWSLGVDVQTDGSAAVADFAWLDPRLTEGRFTGGVDLRLAETLAVELQELRVDVGASTLVTNGFVEVGSGLRFRDLEVRASPLEVERAEPWLGREVDAVSSLEGRVRLSGPLSALAAAGRVSLVPPGGTAGPTTADFQGTLHLGDDPGVSDLRAVIDPLGFDLVRAFEPRVPVRGVGRLEVQASGRAAGGYRFVADLRHSGESVPSSAISAQGSAVRSEEGEWVIDAEADLAPLSLAAVGSPDLDLGLSGSLAGRVRVSGPIGGLTVVGDLNVEGGTLHVDLGFDAREPGRAYRLDATAEGVGLAGLIAWLPEPSVFTGRVLLEGSGLDPDSMDVRGSVIASDVRFGTLRFNTIAMDFAAGDGMLTMDTVDVDARGMRLAGSGSIGIAAGTRGSARLTFESDSLLGLRPLFMGDSVIARDTLSVLDREILRLRGIEADTLPMLGDVVMSGRMSGAVTVSGSFHDLSLSGTATMENAVLGAERVDEARLDLDGRHVLSESREIDAILDARGLSVLGKDFESVHVELSTVGRDGTGQVSFVGSNERYAAGGSFTFTEEGGAVHLREASLEMDSLRWSNSGPADVTWDTAGITLRGVEFVRAGVEPLYLAAEGTLAWSGESDLRVEGTGLDLGIAARVLQRPELDMGGIVDLSVTVSGPAAAPNIVAYLQVDDPRYGVLALSRVAGAIAYRNRVAIVRVEAYDGARRVLDAAGAVPVDLALRPEGRRVLPVPMDVRVVADSLDLAVAVGYLSFLTDVDGVIGGEFLIRGTLDAPEPSGVVQVSGGAWTIDVLGVRHTALEGSLVLQPDRRVEVSLTAGAAGGTSSLSGEVTLAPLPDAPLALTIVFEEFEVVNRLDVQARISGEVRLGGSYQRPLLEGSLSVDQGTLYLEEFARSAEIVDLTDPRIFDVVDTTALSSRPLLAGIRNPFLQSLRANVDLSVPRNAWLRSEDADVEIGGELTVSYDRQSRDIVMVGDLQALRGQYTVLGRRFEVRAGTVSFIGTPGINPALNIQAVSRLRRVGGDPLEVTATVAGSLTQPRVTLSTDEQGIAESDLVSYLIFGRPSSELATGQSALLQGATDAGVTFLSGALATRLGAAVAQRIGVDYLSITQAGDFSTGADPTLAGTQVEIGQYVGDDVFFVLILRPLSGQGSAGTDFFGGARLEIALSDEYNVQAFWEDRFLRGRVGGFGELGLQASEVVGVFIFREAGY